MTKQDLINKVSSQTGIERCAVAVAIDTAAEVIKDCLANGETMYMRGFGTLGPKLRKAKIGRNISRGVSIEIPAHYIPFFKPSKELKQKLLK